MCFVNTNFSLAIFAKSIYFFRQSIVLEEMSSTMPSTCLYQNWRERLVKYQQVSTYNHPHDVPGSAGS
jgi:hypothetical protein